MSEDVGTVDLYLSKLTKAWVSNHGGAEQLLGKAREELMTIGCDGIDFFFHIFEFDGQDFACRPQRHSSTGKSRVWVGFVTMVEVAPLNVADGHPFHGKTLMMPDFEDEEAD